METAIKRDMLFLLTVRPFGKTKRHGVMFRKGGEPVHLKPPIDWEQDPFNDRNWCFNLHALRAIDPALDKHLRTDKPQPLEYALKWILDWRRAQIEGTVSEFANHDMACGLRAARIAYVLQHAEVGGFPIKTHELNKLRALAGEHIAVLSDPDFLAHNNHALFQIVGLYAAGLAVGGEAGAAARALASEFLEDRTAKWFTPRGIHKEHSPEYHAFVTRELLRLPKALRTKRLSMLLKQADALTQKFVGAGNTLLPIGDTSTPQKFKVTDKTRSTVLAGKKVQLSDLSSDGYVMSKRSSESFIFHASAFSGVHKHADDLSFMWSDSVAPLFIDAGKYSYDKDELRQFIVSCRAHNTVSLASQLPAPDSIEWPESGTGIKDVVACDEDGLRLSGEVHRPSLFHQSRRLLYRPGVLIEIEDTVENFTRHAAESLLQIDGEASVKRIGRSTIIIKRGKTRVRVSWSGGRLHHYHGSTNPRYGWRSRTYRQLEPCHTLALRRSGRAVNLRWRIELKSIERHEKR
ncbi:hypothetical protein X907_2158 [Glycocaulis alkaliphilus]|uniref:Uncharacterized protein n=1 Tax=Glycocaulis alkaliphilus TaxID=1434191 RepID=A0A3T0EBH2_9PROT|nr:heparinase II/III family protein [Glycocaulis alkaliphilus]AZU04679.1 hypothetical protein X907_2158 [Glycocaulis alkaliphilus]GGB68578.1 hypothetical protein GCM10007417_05460 [Glycocaulis alkaliphilus]